MSDIGIPERATQNRVVALFRDELKYHYLGDWIDREDNRNIEPELLSSFLKKQGHDESLIGKVLYQLEKAVGDTSKSLYDRNRAVYELLRYAIIHRDYSSGSPIQISVYEDKLMLVPASVEAQLTGRQRQMVAMLAQGESLTSKVCQDKFKVSGPTIYADFKTLLRLGIATPLGAGRTTRYVLNVQPESLSNR